MKWLLSLAALSLIATGCSHSRGAACRPACAPTPACIPAAPCCGGSPGYSEGYAQPGAMMMGAPTTTTVIQGSPSIPGPENYAPATVQ
ncbi:MAG TPA: hypothetical protein VGJ16_09895 [Pirellulales bacterium]